MKDFKVRCIKPSGSWMTLNKIYDVKDNGLRDDEGWVYEFISVEDYNSVSINNSQFELVTSIKYTWDELKGKFYSVDSNQLSDTFFKKETNIAFFKSHYPACKISVYNDDTYDVNITINDTYSNGEFISEQLKKYTDIEFDIQVMSDKDKKIEEIELTIKKAQQQLKELKGIK